MTDRKRSEILPINKLRNKIKTLLRILNEDKISLYAAESAFYIILSFVPFVLLLLTIARWIIPDGVIDYLYSFAEHLPPAVSELLTDEIRTLSESPAPTPLSLSALGVLWSASRGVRAVRRGVRSVYGEADGGFLSEIFGGLFLTVIFVVLIVAVLVFLVFGNTLSTMISDAFPALQYFIDLILSFSPVFFAVLLTLFFAFVLRAFTPRSAKMNRCR